VHSKARKSERISSASDDAATNQECRAEGRGKSTADNIQDRTRHQQRVRKVNVLTAGFVALGPVPATAPYCTGWVDGTGAVTPIVGGYDVL
jgi:hypothetical protein